MAHPAYVDIFCEKHETWHQESICPLCYHEENQICEDHGEYSGTRCGKCRAEAFAEDEHMEKHYERKYGGKP